MAAGDQLHRFTAAMGMPTGANSAQREFLVGATTATGGAERVPVIAFDGGSTDEHWDFTDVLSRAYAGGGLTLRVWWSHTGSSGNTRLGAAFRRVQDDGEDIDTTAHTYSFQEVTDANPSAVGEFTAAEITFTDGAQMDSLAVGEPFVLRIRREASDTTNDTIAADIQIAWVELRETP